jgi:hypothetical protein
MTAHSSLLNYINVFIFQCSDAPYDGTIQSRLPSHYSHNMNHSQKAKKGCEIMMSTTDVKVYNA